MRTAGRALVAVSCVWVLAGAASVPAQDLPVVRLVATGGTISSRPGSRLTAADLIEATPALRAHVRPEFEQFANTASSALTIGQYLGLAQRLPALFAERADLAGLVVTSGTDTLEELAYFLHLTVRDERPVVVVGAMRNAVTVGYDGPANLLAGFRVAASRESRGKGTLVVLNDEINSAREAAKTDALRLHTFQSRGAGVLGVVDQDRVLYVRAPVKRHSAASEFDVRDLTSLPRVDIALVYQDAPGDVIRAMVQHGARGIVVAAAGAGATSGTQNDAIMEALRAGVTVVTTSRTGSGRVAPRPIAASARAIAGEDLAPVKARLLLMLALTRTSDPAEMQRMFSQY